ncbi:MAG: hypothetical protein EOO73_17715 [Myxococcales bacterium]|nr:MAG: hypothetical protein EOO73_17715 [Myxococcales bacterium]
MARARGRFLLFLTPVSAVAVVLLGVVSGGVRPYRSARVYSGPTEGITNLSLRVELGDRDRVVEVPAASVPFVVTALDGGQPVASARGRSDSSGSAEVSLRLPRARNSALELWVEPVGHDLPALARGLVLGSGAAFRRGATRRGGFQRGRSTGDIELAVAPAHGVLITAQGALEDELVIRARRGDAPVAAAPVTAKLEGAEPAEAHVVTDARGLARLRLRPSEPVVRVALSVSAEGAVGTLASRIEVVQGAIRALKQGDRLRLESSGAATTAHLGFFDENQRYGGARAELTTSPDGRLVGELPWPPGLVAAPLWVVASSQPDLASPSAVGWPAVGFAEPDPQTFDARELLLLDGAPAARTREERRAQRIRWVTAAYAAVALLATLVLFVRRVREADARIEEHLAEAGVDDAAHAIAPVRKARAVLAAACIGLGFVVLCVFALLKD